MEMTSPAISETVSGKFTRQRLADCSLYYLKTLGVPACRRRAVVRAAHRATCGVSPQAGFHRPLASLGWRLRPGSLIRACVPRLPDTGGGVWGGGLAVSLHRIPPCLPSRAARRRRLRHGSRPWTL